jgi:hypothetical protein
LCLDFHGTRKYGAVDNKNMFSLLSPVIATHSNDSFSLAPFCEKNLVYIRKFPPFLAPTHHHRRTLLASARSREEQVAYPSQRQALPFLLLLPATFKNKAACKKPAPALASARQNLYEIKRGGKGFCLFSAQLAQWQWQPFLCALQI